MRKVTQEICSAFEQRRKRTLGNTHTDGDALFLHGNKIAEWRGNDKWITIAGWQTKTTKERLNGLAGVSLSQKNFQLYLNGHEWDGKWISLFGKNWLSAYKPVKIEQ